MRVPDGEEKEDGSERYLRRQWLTIFSQLRKYIKSQIQETINTKQVEYKEPHHAHHGQNAKSQRDRKKINLNQPKMGGVVLPSKKQ